MSSSDTVNPEAHAGQDKKRKRTVAYGRDEYLEYLRSDGWRQTKLRYMRSNMPKACYVCDTSWRKGAGFDFHHKTFENLGCERLIDIGLLCRECHNALHWGQKLRRMQLWTASKRNTVRKIGGLRRA